MRLITLLVAALAACGPISSATPSPSRSPAPVDCRPTIVRMVPPQMVMDAIFAGISPQPSATPLRETWAASTNWIGNDALWVSLPNDGVFQRKYTKLYAMALRSGPIMVTGRRIEGPAAPSVIGSMNSDNFGSSISFAEAGCWEVTYDFAGEQLRFTLKVVDT